MPSPIPRYASLFFATLCIGFGFNAIFNQASAMSFFELPYSTSNTQHKLLVDALLAVYGVRDIFMGVAMYAAAWYADTRPGRKALGWIVLAAGVTAAADGAICKFIVGEGEWNHWGYAPVVVAVGASMIAGL